MAEAAAAAIRQHEASEIVRRYQQGHGRPIISIEFEGYRLVAVGKKLKWSKAWKWFPDFLLDHLKDSLGRPWGTQAQREGLDHPVFRWLSLMNEYANRHRVPGTSTFTSGTSGFLGAIFRLGYALYLIEHNDQLDPKLIRRLRMPRFFRATYYEAHLAAAFAVSGAEIKMAEVGRGSRATPEFWATGKSGVRYAIEAKCKEGWKSPCDPSNAAFRDELRQWLRDQIHKASSKELPNPIYCFELSIPAPLDEAQWEEIHALTRDIVREAEALTVKGKPPVSSYIVITNNADVLTDEGVPLSHIAMLLGYRMSNFAHNIELPIETALEWHDAHRDIHWVMDCLEEIEQVPSTFDGTPPELNVDDGSPATLRLGQRIEYEGPDGLPCIGTVYDICAANDYAHIAVECDGKHHILKGPLSPREMEGHRRYGDAIFGKPQKRRKNLNGDPLAFYDWIREVYTDYPVEALLRQLPDHPDIERIKLLPIGEMRVRVAREVTKAAVATSGRRGQV